MRKLIYYVAASADGFIARPDGDIEWLTRFGSAADYGTAEFMKGIDTVIMGRSTWEFVQEHTRAGVDPYQGMETWVLTGTLEHAAGARILREEDIPAVVEELRGSAGKDVWLLGGGRSVAAFLDRGLLDEVIVHLMPVLLGEGIPLFGPARRDEALDLLDLERYQDGVVRLRYAVGQATSPAARTARAAEP